MQGESSIEAVQRETQEEMGIDFSYNDFKFIVRKFFSRFFMDIYETVWNGKAEDISQRIYKNLSQRAHEQIKTEVHRLPKLDARQMIIEMHRAKINETLNIIETT